MYLSNIKLWNFRKYGSDTFDINKPNLDLNFTERLNVLIGENDSGKTAIIDAIKIVLKTHSYEYIKIEADDFYNNSDRLRIELEFKGLLDEEAKNFIEWLTWEGQGEDLTPILRVFYDVRRKDYKILPSEVRAGEDTEGNRLTAEAKEFLKITYLRPLRDAESGLVPKRNSRLSQILLGDDIFKVDNHFLVSKFRDINDELKKYFNEGDGSPIKENINKYIKGFYGQEKEVIFETASNDIKSILEKLSLLLSGEDNVGLGTLNRIFMATELLHLDKENREGLRLGLIEELEAHLHPQAQMQVIETLQKQEKVQLIITTHSPNLASKIKLGNLIICSGNNAFPMGKDYTKLKEDSYVFLEKFLDVTKSNLFFAKGVILVEGWAEEILIPSLAKAIGIDLTAKGVSVVNIGNVGFDHYSKIFLRKNAPFMDIPVAVVTDCDVREYELDGNEYERKDNIDSERKSKINEIESKSFENVKYFVAPHWTLEYCLNLSDTLKQEFQKIVKSIHTRGGWNSDFEKELARKLIIGKLEKTEIAYKLANYLDSLENIPLEESDTICYLKKAIEYAAGN
ncbi:ATP-dependent nuclease [Capnocytophaga granulosa]